MGEKQTAAEKLRDLKKKKKDKEEPPKKRPTPKEPPKKQAPKKGPRAKKQQATYETSLHSSDDTGEDVFHSNRLDKQLNPEYSFTRRYSSDTTISDTDSNASPVKKAPRKTSQVLLSSDSEATQAWENIVKNQPKTGPGGDGEGGLSDIDEESETSDIEVIAEATPPLRRTNSGRTVVTPGWRLTASERRRRKEKSEQKKRSHSEATIVHDGPVTGPRGDEDRRLSDIIEEFETSDIEDEIEFNDS